MAKSGIALNFTGMLYPAEYVTSTRAQLRMKGLMTHYIRKAVPWQCRSAMTLAKVPYTALNPTERLMYWRITFGLTAYILKEIKGAELKGKMPLKEAGRVAPAGLQVPIVAYYMQTIWKHRGAEFLNSLNVQYNMIFVHGKESEKVFPSKVFRTAHTVYDYIEKVGVAKASEIGTKIMARLRELGLPVKPVDVYAPGSTEKLVTILPP